MFLKQIGNFLHHLAEKLNFFNKSHRKDTLLDTDPFSCYVTFHLFFPLLISQSFLTSYFSLPNRFSHPASYNSHPK